MSRRLLPSPFALRRFALIQQTRANSTLYGSSAKGSVINIQQIPAPGAGHIRVLLLNRPEARNAISRQLLDSLRKHIKAIEEEKGNGPTRALVLASDVDAAFCAGADLKERAGFTREETESFLSQLRQTFTSLAALPIPTITAISSMALGGGLELALSTNLRVFGSTSTVGLPETRLAIIPGAGGTYRLPRLIGENRALDMILTGRRISAPESYFIGLCNRLVEVTAEEAGQPGAAREKVLHESIKLALDICEGGPVALKQAMVAVRGFEKGEEAENQAYLGVVDTEDRYEALKAFAEKRKPYFKGK
ncbi:hypothetical protein FQN50_003430 [Emmonsiellopsis sp. PD_5]|nr:hypothetical protein FQN50_003430 [Emmonsiellopsis sp. PD_5]